MNPKDFDPTRIIKTSIDKVEPNDYNPKEKNTPEYQNVVKSIQINGLKQPVFVRRVKGNDNFVIVDGEQRYTAAKQLGYKEIYVYDLGEISEEEAKSLTIWMEVQVPFTEIDLAPLVMELNNLEMELPYTDLEIDGFKNLATFDFDTAYQEKTPVPEDGPKDEEVLTIKMTSAQMETIKTAIDNVIQFADNSMTEGEALAMLCEEGWENLKEES